MTFKFTETNCYLISLKSRQDRRELFIENFKQHGFELDKFQWVQAIEDSNFGGLGCAKSHLIAMTKFLTETDDKYCCIFEDDFHFRINKSLCEIIINKSFNNYTESKVFLFAGTNVIPIEAVETIEGHQLNKIFEASSTSGYIIKRDYVRKVMDKFIEAIIGMEKFRNVSARDIIYDRFAIDQIWKSLQRIDDWYCTIPMLGYQIDSFSDIEKRNVDYSKYSL